MPIKGVKVFCDGEWKPSEIGIAGGRIEKVADLGMSLEAVMERASTRPAEVIGLDRKLGPGHEAAITVFEVVEGAYPIEDCWGEKRLARRRIKPVAVALGGRVADCR